MGTAEIVLVVALAASPIAQGQSTPPPSQRGADAAAVSPQPPPSSRRSNPFDQLFSPAPDAGFGRRPRVLPRFEPAGSSPPAAAGSGSTAWPPNVVCGMVLIPGDPGIDPGIQLKARDPDVRYTIRAIQPPICSPSGREPTR
jgi:hypothetical protein